VQHGFLRTPDGAFTTIDAPDAGTAAYQGTQAANMNTQGTIAGSYIDKNGMCIKRARNGKKDKGSLTLLGIPNASWAKPGSTARRIPYPAFRAILPLPAGERGIGQF
jgi:hypothetical protein